MLLGIKEAQTDINESKHQIHIPYLFRDNMLHTSIL